MRQDGARHLKKRQARSAVYGAAINSMKYAWIGRQKNYWPIALQREVLNVSASGYFKHQRRQDSDLSAKYDKRVDDDALLVYIKSAHAGSNGEYGWHNAPTEYLCGSLKAGWLYGMRFATRRQAMDEMIDWLMYYNHCRRHSTPGYISPMQFEQSWFVALVEGCRITDVLRDTKCWGKSAFRQADKLKSAQSTHQTHTKTPACAFHVLADYQSRLLKNPSG